LYILFRVLYAFCREPSLCPAYVLSFKVIAFLITFGIIVAMNANIERLRTNAMEQVFPNNHEEIYAKLQMFKFVFCLVLFNIVVELIDGHFWHI
jgi:hypothetical protein